MVIYLIFIRKRVSLATKVFDDTSDWETHFIAIPIYPYEVAWKGHPVSIDEFERKIVLVVDVPPEDNWTLLMLLRNLATIPTGDV